MANYREELLKRLQEKLGQQLHSTKIAHKEITLEVVPNQLLAVCQTLRDDFGFEQLIDLCGVDYGAYGQADWDVKANDTGFSRGVSDKSHQENKSSPRYAVVYHLLSVKNNQRVRVRVFAEGDYPRVDSVVSIWNSADWYEREAFDLFGILFEGHPDLRRILTDYGFIGHPFRKDFPVSGHVEMRYDAEKKRVIYEPVSLEPRTLVPRVVRQDNRYTTEG